MYLMLNVSPSPPLVLSLYCKRIIVNDYNFFEKRRLSIILIYYANSGYKITLYYFA